MPGRSEQRLTKRQQKLAERGVEKFPTIGQSHLDLKTIIPKTDHQIQAFDAYENEQTICLLGCPGTGKTFISLYLALREIADRKSPRRKLVIIRSAQSSKDIGFLPGDEKRKLEVYEAPYRSICAELYGRGDAYDILKQKGIIEFQGTSFLRGVNIEDSIVLIDETQNLRYIELKTVLTRISGESRVILCGDIHQDDLTSERYKEQSGLSKILNVMYNMSDVQMVMFEPKDIVRSGFVRRFIEAEYDLGYC